MGGREAGAPCSDRWGRDAGLPALARAHTALACSSSSPSLRAARARAPSPRRSPLGSLAPVHTTSSVVRRWGCATCLPSSCDSPSTTRETRRLCGPSGRRSSARSRQSPATPGWRRRTFCARPGWWRTSRRFRNTARSPWWACSGSAVPWSGVSGVWVTLAGWETAASGTSMRRRAETCCRFPTSWRPARSDWPFGMCWRWSAARRGCGGRCRRGLPARP